MTTTGPRPSQIGRVLPVAVLDAPFRPYRPNAVIQCPGMPVRKPPFVRPDGMMKGMMQAERSTLGTVLRAAEGRKLTDACVFLHADDDQRWDSECLIVENCEQSTEIAIAAGFPVEGLDTPSLEDCAAWAENLEKPPSQRLLLYAFRYYLKFDAFPLQSYAQDPPAAEELKLRELRRFYNLLGEERSDVPCRHEGCSHGAIEHSVLCRAHHFEMVRKEPCPF
jgi:hypothetical protein